MELLQLVNETTTIFGVNNVSELSDKFKTVVLSNDFEKYAKFEELVQDLSVDWLQKIFQYYEADRKEKKQDYTPKCLAHLVGRLTDKENQVCVDMCAGSGALTIQKWNIDKTAKFICLEFDEKVIPYLLFNLALRNITATVYNCDVLSGEVFAKYEVKSGEKYSLVELAKDKDMTVKGDTCISNPPYNMKWELPVFAQMQPRFQAYEIPPESNSNYAFILSALDYCDKVAMIMPCSILQTKDKREYEIKKQLIEQNYIESVITCPNNMFEATGISVCVIVFNKNKATSGIEMIDMRNNHETEIREQNGQFGGKSHTNRTYKKEVNVFSEQNIQYIIDCINGYKTENEHCVCVNIDEVCKNKYSLLPSAYFEVDFFKESKHRPYEEIVADLNRCVALKNACKLTINETIAKQIGFDVEAFKSDNKELDNADFIEKISGIRPIKHNYISFTKNKNEVKFENGSKEIVSPIFMLLFAQWKQMIYQCNIDENRYLVELRDALLPDLMSGKISIDEE